MENKKIVAGYGRVSQKDKAEKGTSREDQEIRVKQECERLKHEWHDFYSDDGFSGKTIEHRPGMQSLIRDAKAGKFNMVMFTKIDRLARNLRDLLNIWHLLHKELKVDVYCIDDPVINSGKDTAELMLSLLGMFAEFERKIIRERTVRGRKFKWTEGEAFIGKAPFGYYQFYKEDKIKEVKIADDQAEIYNKIVSLYLNEHFSMKDIANRLNADGVSPPSVMAKKWKRRAAKQWSSSTIAKILRSPAYKGEAIGNRRIYETAVSKNGNQYVFPGKVDKPKDEWIPVKFPPLISEEKWDQIQARIQQQKFKKKRVYKGYEDHFLVENFIHCGECGGKMIKRLKQEKDGKKRFYYVCFWKACGQKELANSGRKKCILKSMDAKRIDDYVYAEIIKGITNPGKFKEQWLKDFDQEETKKKLESLQKKKAGLEKKIERGFNLITDELDPHVKKLYEGEHEKYKKEFRELISDLQKMESKNDFIQNRFDRLAQFEDAYKKADWRGQIPLTYKTQGRFMTYLDGLPFKERKRIIEAIVSPETGGKCTVRYVRPIDYLDGEEIKAIPRKEQKAILYKPQTDRDPYVEVEYLADLNKIEALIRGLDKVELLNKFGTCRISKGEEDVDRWGWTS